MLLLTEGIHILQNHLDDFLCIKKPFLPLMDGVDVIVMSRFVLHILHSLSPYDMPDLFTKEASQFIECFERMHIPTIIIIIIDFNTDRVEISAHS